MKAVRQNLSIPTNGTSSRFVLPTAGMLIPDLILGMSAYNIPPPPTPLQGYYHRKAAAGLPLRLLHLGFQLNKFCKFNESIILLRFHFVVYVYDFFMHIVEHIYSSQTPQRCHIIWHIHDLTPINLRPQFKPIIHSSLPLHTFIT